MARIPVECELPVEMPADTYRIFVLGGSAAMGTPDEAYSFGRILGVMLEDAYPDVPFEVVNASITAVNSHVLLPIARSCAAYDPDLFIVYAGNNEVVGPYGAGTIFGSYSPSLAVIRLGVWARSTRLGYLLDRALNTRGPTGKWEGMKMFVRSRVPRTDPRLRRIQEHFEANLSDIVDLGVPVLLCTVGVNLADSPPFASMHARPDTGEDEAWRSAVAEGEQALSMGDVEVALDSFRRAATLDTGYAEVVYRLGQCSERLGEVEGASADYARACELDALRFRADTAVNQTIRRIAASSSGYDVTLADCEAAVVKASPRGLPGETLFYDHVHYTFAGNHLVAKTLFEAIRQRLAEDLGPPLRSEPASLETCAERLAYTNWDRYRVYGEVVDLMNEPPFTYQADHPERASRREEHRLELRSALTWDEMEAALLDYEAALARSPDDIPVRVNLTRLLQEMGDLQAAASHLENLLGRLPDAVLWQKMLSDVLMIEMSERPPCLGSDHFL
jgi:tetratricopeptide (TPR) repeat protein